MSRRSNRPRWPSRSSACPGRRRSATGMGRSPAGPRSISYRRLAITGLLPRGRYRFELRRNGAVVSDAIATTLPVDLPRLDERPFTIMLGSCFARSADGAGNAGRAYSQLPADARADLKILCGDQVYLDQPTTEFLGHTHNADQLRERHLGNYANAWSQTGGFRELLAGRWHVLQLGRPRLLEQRPEPDDHRPRHVVPAGTRRLEGGREGALRGVPATGRGGRRHVQGREAVVLRRRHPHRPDHRAGRIRDRRPARRRSSTGWRPSTVRAAWSSAS